MICYALTSIQVHPKSECKRNQQCTPLEWSPSATETVDFRLMSWRVTVLMSKIYILMVYACKHTNEKKKIKITSCIKSVYYPGVCSTLLSTNSISALTRFSFFFATTSAETGIGTLSDCSSSWHEVIKFTFLSCRIDFVLCSCSCQMFSLINVQTQGRVRCQHPYGSFIQVLKLCVVASH